MKHLLTLPVAMALLSVVLPLSHARAQPAPSSQNIMEMEDLSRPPAGAVAPQPIGPRDITMANYSAESIAAGEEGSVRLRALVTADGTVEDARVEASSGFERLDRSSTELVRTWRYKPGTLNGSPVAARFPVILQWKLLVLPYKLPVKEALGFRSAPYPSVSAVIRFLVAADGGIVNAKIERSSGHTELDNAALSRVMTWRLKPATLRDGSAVSVWMRMPFLFGSDGNSANEVAFVPGQTIELGDLKHGPPGIGLPTATNSHAMTSIDQYPAQSLRLNEQGAVGVRYLILEDGTVGDIRLMKSSGHSRLNQAAFAIIALWNFTPATQLDKPIRVWVGSYFVFQLR